MNTMTPTYPTTSIKVSNWLANIESINSAKTDFSNAIGKAWECHIREFLVRKLGLPPSFDARDHASFIANHGRFLIHRDGSKEFLWDGIPVLRGSMEKDERSMKYMITKDQKK